MLTGVTGLPGACKTLYTLSVLFKLYKGRQIYVYNIDGIDHEYFGTIPIEDPETWYELPSGAVIVMDEAQSVFPLRMAGSQVPLKCSKFEEHRHQGHDIILITQDATLLDVHIRKLMGKHFHCKRLFGTQSATIFEYNKFEQKPEDANTIKKAVSSNVWQFDKSIYKHYHSADIHTVKRKLPKKLVVVPAVVLSAVVALYFAISTVYAMFTDDMEDVKNKIQGRESTESGEVVYQSPENNLKSWVNSRTPIVEGLPWTAPMYSKVMEVKQFPKPHCIIFGMDEFSIGQCQCYTQQVTKLNGVNDAACRQIAQDGWFDYTMESKTAPANQGAPAPNAAAVDPHVSNGQRLPRVTGYVHSDYTPSWMDRN